MNITLREKTKKIRDLEVGECAVSLDRRRFFLKTFARSDVLAGERCPKVIIELGNPQDQHLDKTIDISEDVIVLPIGSIFTFKL